MRRIVSTTWMLMGCFVLVSCNGLRMPWEPPQTSFPTPTPAGPAVAEKPQPKPAPAISAKENRVVGGYYSWCKAQPFDKISFENYTYIVHAFLSAGSDGKLQFRPDRKMPSGELTSLAHRKNVKVIISLGGGRYTHFEKITASKWARQRFLISALDVVEKYGYDGIDLDWEYPRDAITSRNWAKLLDDLRTGLDELSRRTGKKYMLTAAVGPVKWFAQWIPARTVHEKLDFLHVMTYNYCGIWGGRAGEHAPIYANPGKGDIASSLKYWTKEKGIPRDKLVIGLPFYSYIFEGYQPGQQVRNGDGSERKVTAIGYAEAMDRISAGGWAKTLDKSTRLQWYRSDNGRAFMVIDGPEAIRYKTLWVLKGGYRGVFCWAMRHDVFPNGDTPLADAMSTAFYYYVSKYLGKK